MEKQFIVGIDEGTTSVRAVLFDTQTNSIVREAKENIVQYFPKTGWVEQDANQIFEATLSVLNKVISGHENSEIAGIGITNQRETVVAWNKETGIPICPAIVWQCRRTSELFKKFSVHTKRKIKKETGLICDAYFSASKMQWILDNIFEARLLESENKLCFGTIDSFLAFKLTGKFVTDTSNASRTMLFSLKTLSYSPAMLKLFRIKQNCLPEIVSSSGYVGNAETCIGIIPLLALIGDQQSSLFAECQSQVGKAKCTFGTGTFILASTGKVANTSSKNLISTVACTVNGETTYALEGSIFNSGTAIEWLKNNLQIISTESESETLAKSIQTNGGVYFVPAFTGLGAPDWNSSARGTIIGLERSSTKAHIARACLEGIAFSTNDILLEMQKCGIRFTELKCNGGGSRNNFTMQFLSDISNLKVLCKDNSEQTILGAVFLAGIAASIYKDVSHVASICEKFSKIYEPNHDSQKIDNLICNWNKAVEKSKNWIEE